MSQPNAIPGPSFQRHDQVEIHSCRWAWCRFTFSANSELVHHVIHEHVRKAVPVMRKDIPILKRAEEGLGDSLSLSGLSIFHPSSSNGSSNNKGKQSVPAEAEPSSSLPSPPVSIPAPLSPLPLLQRPSYLSSPPASSEQNSDYETPHETLLHTFDQSPSASSVAPRRQKRIQVRSKSPTTPQVVPMRHLPVEVTPTFAALSSPADSPPILNIPLSPSFNSMVANATGKRKRGTIDSSIAPSQLLPWGRKSIESQCSLSSSGSQDSVEKQLTQSIDTDGDKQDYAYPRDESRTEISGGSTAMEGGGRHIHVVGSQSSTDINAQRQLSSSPLLSQTQSETPNQSPVPQRVHPLIPPIVGGNISSAVSTPVRGHKQAWYGTRPHTKHRRLSRPSSKINPPSSHASFHEQNSSQSQLSSPSKTTRGQPVQSSYYGSGHISPFAPPAGTELEPAFEDERENMDTQSQSQSQSQGSTFEYASYPLYTQAPYQSQSLSQ